MYFSPYNILIYSPYTAVGLLSVVNLMTIRPELDIDKLKLPSCPISFHNVTKKAKLCLERFWFNVIKGEINPLLLIRAVTVPSAWKKPLAIPLKSSAEKLVGFFHSDFTKKSFSFW